MSLEVYPSLITDEALIAQLNFERELWLYHKAVDERANHRNPEAVTFRRQAMERIDGFLDIILKNWEDSTQQVESD